MESIIREHIAELEKDLEKVQKKITPDNRNVVKFAIEAEKIKFAINQLYICLGQNTGRT